MFHLIMFNLTFPSRVGWKQMHTAPAIYTSKEQQNVKINIPDITRTKKSYSGRLMAAKRRLYFVQ